MKFTTRLVWSGADKTSARDPATYSRDLELSMADVTLPLSAAPEYRGDAARPNPEQLFLGALSSCHALTFLFVAARSGITVLSYRDEAQGLLEQVDGRPRMTHVTLRPHIVIQAGDSEDRARELVDKAHAGCFIANSVTSVVEVDPRIQVAADSAA